MDLVLDRCAHDDVRAVYRRYRAQLAVSDTGETDGAWYREGDGVHLHLTDTACGDLISTPYQTAFHEFGHNLDFLLGKGAPVSERWGNNALYFAIQQDFLALRGSRSNEELVAGLEQLRRQRGWSYRDVASASDILECMTRIPAPLGAGHMPGDPDYWEYRLPNKEFFAETLDGAAANEGSYQVMKALFPHAVDVVHQILRDGLA